jgi:hypothetical protein
MLGMGTNMYPSLALLKQCKDELIASTGGARVNSWGEGANRTIYLINMLINHLNMLVTVHPLENMQTGGGGGLASTRLRPDCLHCRGRRLRLPW